MRRDCPARDQHLRRKRTEGITTRAKNQKGEATCKQCKRTTLLGCWHVPESYVLTACKRSISDPAHTSGCLCSPRATHVGRQQRRRRTGTCSGTRRTVEPPDRKKKPELRKYPSESRTKSTTRATISKKNVHQPDQKKTRNRVPPGVDTQPRGTCQQHANLSDPAHTSGS